METMALAKVPHDASRFFQKAMEINLHHMHAVKPCLEEAQPDNQVAGRMSHFPHRSYARWRNYTLQYNYAVFSSLPNGLKYYYHPVLKHP
jgi:hypothetical protein